MDDHFRLDGFAPYSPQSEELAGDLLLSADTRHVLAAHHAHDGRDSHLLAYDRAAIWSSVPGAPAYLTVHVHRGSDRTYDIDAKRHPLLPLAQNWLIRKGCPAEATLAPGGPEPADAHTSRIEDRLRLDRIGRYTVIDHQASEPAYPHTEGETWALLQDRHREAAATPFLLVVETTSADLAQYSVREASFTTRDAAMRWLDERDQPLSTDPSGLRAEAARSRSTAALSPTAAAPPTTPAEPAAPAPEPPRSRPNTRSAP